MIKEAHKGRYRLIKGVLFGASNSLMLDTFSFKYKFFIQLLYLITILSGNEISVCYLIYIYIYFKGLKYHTIWLI